MLGLLIWSLWPVRALQIANDTSRRVIARVALRRETPLRLGYVHSVYRQPGIEEFVLRPDGLELVRLASPSAAVLEYYARPEPIRATGQAYEIRLKPERYVCLPLRVSSVGRRTVAYAGRELPLHELAADGDRVTLQVVPVPRLAVFMTQEVLGRRRQVGRDAEPSPPATSDVPATSKKGAPDVNRSPRYPVAP